VYQGHHKVGYLRLRHGYFTAQYDWPDGPIVYSANTKGDGTFKESEREYHLTQAKMAISGEIDKARKEGKWRW
jgi:hypothetical protein